MTRHMLNHLEYLDHLIRTKGTGTPAQLARKLEISQRCLYDNINFMKERGAPIMYDRKRNSYYYEEDGQFYFKFLKNKFSPKNEMGGGNQSSKTVASFILFS